MKSYDPSEPLFSIHIPKSGGSSFGKVLKQWYGNKLQLHYFDEQKKKMPSPVRLTRFFSGKTINGICIHGHFNALRGFGIRQQYPEAGQFISFLRDPVEMQISLFFFQQERQNQGQFYRDGEKAELFTDNVDEFLERSEPHMLLHFPSALNRSNFKVFIKTHFVHLGLAEDLQNSVDILAEKLGKPKVQLPHLNQSDRSQNPSESSMVKFREKCDFEMELYEFARELHGQA